MSKRENRRDYYMIAPESLKIQTDPAGKFYDPRAELPLVEETVLNIMTLGVLETIIAVSTEEGDYVVSGRQRTKHAVEANKRLKKQGDTPLLVPVRFAKDNDVIPMLEVSLNEHRQDDSPLVKIGKAMALREKYSDEQIAASFRIGVPQLRNWFKVDTLSAPVKKAIEAGKIAPSAAVKLAKLEPAQQKEALDKLEANPTVKNAAKVAKGDKPERKDKNQVFYDAIERLKERVMEHSRDKNRAESVSELLEKLMSLHCGDCTEDDVWDAIQEI